MAVLAITAEETISRKWERYAIKMIKEAVGL
jgi:hypothetical protein